MVTGGAFGPETQVELLGGEIVDMPPPGPKHAAAVSKLHLCLSELLRRRAILWPQGNPIRLPESNSRPQPDMALLKWRDDHYVDMEPGPEAVILLIEVSDSTLAYDQGRKLRFYAQAGIREYWIVNIAESAIEVYTDPAEGTYQSLKLARIGDALPLPDDLEVSIAVADVLES